MPLLGNLPRAIALWGLRPEDQAGTVVIVQRSTEFTTAQTVFAGAVVAEHIQRHPPHQRQVFSRVRLAGAVGIFPELDIEQPLLPVLDTPVATHRVGKPRRVSE